SRPTTCDHEIGPERPRRGSATTTDTRKRPTSDRCNGAAVMPKRYGGQSFKLTFDRAPRFVLLLVAIVAELMLAPLFVDSDFGLHAAQGAASIVIFAALWAAGAHATSVLFFIPTIVAQLFAGYWGGAPLHAAALALRIVFLSYVT